MEEKKKKVQATLLFKAAKKPPREHISKEEFRRRLKNIGEWRKKRLAELRNRVSRA